MYVCINEHRLTVVHARSYISLACMKYYAQPEAQSLSRNFNPKQYRHSIKIKEKWEKGTYPALTISFVPESCF